MGRAVVLSLVGKYLRTVVSLIGFTMAVGVGFAQWPGLPDDGVLLGTSRFGPIYTDSYPNFPDVVSVGDGSGGAVVAVGGGVTTDSVALRLLDDDGYLASDNLDSDNITKTGHDLIRDDAGNRYFAWSNEQDIFVQKYDVNGIVQWGASGSRVTSITLMGHKERGPLAVSDGDGGVL